jgi:hypothetical protein
MAERSGMPKNRGRFQVLKTVDSYSRRRDYEGRNLPVSSKQQRFLVNESREGGGR